MNFASDNGAGVAPQILDAIVASSRVNAPAYGADEYTARAQGLLSEVFETEVAAFLVATGTAANALALSALVNPWTPFSVTTKRISTTMNAAPRSCSPPGRNWSASRARAARSLRKACVRPWRGFRGAGEVGAAGRAVAFSGD